MVFYVFSIIFLYRDFFFLFVVVKLTKNQAVKDLSSFFFFVASLHISHHICAFPLIAPLSVGLTVDFAFG